MWRCAGVESECVRKKKSERAFSYRCDKSKADGWAGEKGCRREKAVLSRRARPNRESTWMWKVRVRDILIPVYNPGNVKMLLSGRPNRIYYLYVKWELVINTDGLLVSLSLSERIRSVICSCLGLYRFVFSIWNNFCGNFAYRRSVVSKTFKNFFITPTYICFFCVFLSV